MNFGAQKIRLIMELRRLGICDDRVLGAIERVPREKFVLTAFQSEAYKNIPLPISQGQTISQPYVVAIMTQELRLDDREVTLEIGCGSGYQAAVLSQICRRVCTIERFPSLLHEAEERFMELGLNNITTRVNDGCKGWPELAPFRRILVTAAAPSIPKQLLQQLDDGGILILPLGGYSGQKLIRITRNGNNFKEEDLLDVRFVPLLEGIARQKA